MLLHENYLILPRETAMRPVDGHVVRVDRWWVVTKEGLVYLTKDKGMSVSAQCNPDMEAVEFLVREVGYPMEVSIERIPLVFERRREDRSWWHRLWLRQHGN